MMTVKDNSWLLSLAFSSDGKRLAAADWNGVVTTWNVESSKVVRDISLPQGVHRVQFTRGYEFVTGCEDGKLRLHSIEK